jgi:hypothetical protein
VSDVLGVCSAARHRPWIGFGTNLTTIATSTSILFSNTDTEEIPFCSRFFAIICLHFHSFPSLPIAVLVSVYYLTHLPAGPPNANQTPSSALIIVKSIPHISAPNLRRQCLISCQCYRRYSLQLSPSFALASRRNVWP